MDIVVDNLIQDEENRGLSTEHGRLYRAAMRGDWVSIENMTNILRRIGSTGVTALHIAAAAGQEEFVKKLLRLIGADNQELAVLNNVGMTALTCAAAVGNVNIARAMVEKNRDLPNLNSGVKPLRMAAFLGHGHMVNYLYTVTTLVGDEAIEIFITCAKNDMYGVALKMLEERIVSVRDRNLMGETALHVLARKPSAFVSASKPGILRRHINIPWLNLRLENSKQSAANELLIKCLLDYRGDVVSLNEIPEIRECLCIAAEVGNVEFLVMLIRFDYDILWRKSQHYKSIFHIAVENRHESIFNLLKEIGSIGEIIVGRTSENGSNILHLAAELAPQVKLNAITGAAFQMQREVLWFKEVGNLVSPDFKEMRNGDGETPYVLFARNHENLRKEGEKWMTSTATSSMVVATLIGSIMFTGQVADGLNKNPHIFLAFSVSTAVSLCGSSTSLIMFLSILTSRYSYEDFLVSLPIRLMIGVTSLYISIIAMMAAFATSFCLKNYNHQDAIFVVIGLCACVPILEALVKYHLFFDMARSIGFRFRPQYRLLYEESQPNEREYHLGPIMV